MSCAAVLGLAGAWSAWSAYARGARSDAGSSLFHGRTTVSARLAGHAQPLPPIASRCGNCHEVVNRAPALAGAVDGTSRVYAAVLDRSRLLHLQPRRGGPPSAYDLPTFCRLLRTGIDPAQVVISETMPRYDVNDEQCRGLWAYVRSR